MREDGERVQFDSDYSGGTALQIFFFLGAWLLCTWKVRMLLIDLVYNWCSFSTGYRVSDLLDRPARSRSWINGTTLRTASLILRREPFHILHRYLIQRTLVCRMQIYLRHSFLTNLPLLEAIECLLPSRRTQTPFTAICQANCAEVIAFGRRIVEEFFSDYTGHGVVAVVFGADATVSITIEAREWLFGEEGEGFFEHWETNSACCHAVCGITIVEVE